MIVLYQWIFAHLLGDFVFQTKAIVEHKRKYKAASWILYVHCLIHGVLIYLFSPDKSIWLIPVIIIVSHYIIDLWKLHSRNNGWSFLIDQALHLLVIFTLWLIYYQPAGWIEIHWESFTTNMKLWIVLTGYLTVIFPLAYTIGYFTTKWRNEVEADVQLSKVSLSEAGKWIGMFERILVLTFVIFSHFEGIGFLIAAKSILRFNDIKGQNVRKEAEYILIGTLMSFAASILVGLIVLRLIAGY